MLSIDEFEKRVDFVYIYCMSAAGKGSDVIYYPFNDLMQLHPSLLTGEPESVSTVPYMPSDSYPSYTTHPSYPRFPYLPQSLESSTPQRGGRKGQGRGGKVKGGRRMNSQDQMDIPNVKVEIQGNNQSFCSPLHFS